MAVELCCVFGKSADECDILRIDQEAAVLICYLSN